MSTDRLTAEDLRLMRRVRAHMDAEHDAALGRLLHYVERLRQKLAEAREDAEFEGRPE